MLIYLMQVIVLIGLLITGTWIFWLWFLAVRSLFPRCLPPFDGRQPYFIIIVPAHNEKKVIGRTVANILAFDYPSEKFKLYVVADNCTDQTAEIAAAGGACCLTRADAQNQGKGHAMAYALERIDQPYDAALFLDADSCPEKNYLQVMARHLANGEEVIQGRYDVDEPERNWFTRLTAVSFVLRNKWVFPAFDAMSVSLPLRGSGMCFSAALIRRTGWQAHGLTEDTEMSLRLMRAGIRITYAPEAVSRQYMPPTPKQAVSQRLRWSAGESNMRALLLRKEIPSALREKRYRTLPCLLFILAPAFSVQLCLVLLLVILSIFSGTILLIISVIIFLAYAIYFMLGFEKHDLGMLSAMTMLPIFAVWRAAMIIKAKLHKPSSWIRTSRDQ